MRRPSLTVSPLGVGVLEFERQTVANPTVQAAYVVPAFQEPDDALPGLLIGSQSVRVLVPLHDHRSTDALPAI
ncbi:hypothetical protein OKW43_002092 [Paraburkholderia sp. WC7.3g]|uniref:hypothetical protein n=1 Tax=Paraburkholderia TaxID=1822464 RepID=UPI001655856A|nr:hypothetical protein [Paraburkholderia podalyriae]